MWLYVVSQAVVWTQGWLLLPIFRNCNKILIMSLMTSPRHQVTGEVQTKVASLTPGKFPCRGNHVLSPMTPASFFSKVNAVYNATAPPCEKPANTIRSEGIPFCSSCAIQLFTVRDWKNKTPPIHYKESHLNVVIYYKNNIILNEMGMLSPGRLLAYKGKQGCAALMVCFFTINP